jgi:putative PIN family toxin of toxin-antitoxin system
MNKPFFVIDTNCFISANLLKNSVSAQAFDKVILNGKLALSNDVLNEYAEVLYREKLDKYLNEDKRQSALNK